MLRNKSYGNVTVEPAEYAFIQLRNEMRKNTITFCRLNSEAPRMIQITDGSPIRYAIAKITKLFMARDLRHSEQR